VHVCAKSTVAQRNYALDPPLANPDVKLKKMPREHPPHHWKEKLGSISEAIVKAERSDDKTPDELRKEGFHHGVTQKTEEQKVKKQEKKQRRLQQQQQQQQQTHTL